MQWRVVRLAERQHGVVSRAQLRALGMTDSAIAHALATGRLHQIFHGAFGLGHRLVGHRGHMLAAVLACGQGTVVSHRAAAKLLGLWDTMPNMVDVIAPVQSGRKIPGIRRSFVPHPEPDEFLERHAIPCTTPSRTIVDLAGLVGTASLRRTVERAAVLRVLDPAEIDLILSRRRRRGRQRLLRILIDWRKTYASKLRSDLEAKLLPMIAARGLPLPRTNYKMMVEGEPKEIDFCWPEHRFAVEADSAAFHDHELGFHRDRDRDRDLTLSDYRLLRITWRQLEEEPTKTMDAIARALTRG